MNLSPKPDGVRPLPSYFGPSTACTAGSEVPKAIVSDTEKIKDPEGHVNNSDPATSNRTLRRAEAEVDRVLMLAAQKGDQGAFRKLVERHQRQAFFVALGIVRDENDAREVCQEAFLRVYRGLDQFKGDSSFSTWLYRIVTNMAIDVIRRTGRREMGRAEEGEEPSGELAPLVATLADADPFQSLRRREIEQRLRAALDALPPYHLGVILMREVEGLSYDEMAEAMGVSKGTIMSRLFHARQKLQRALVDCYEEERDEKTAEPQGPRGVSQGKESS